MGMGIQIRGCFAVSFDLKGNRFPAKGRLGTVNERSAQPQNSPAWVRAPTAKPSECRQAGTRGSGYPVKGMFFSIVWFLGTSLLGALLPVPPETKQLPISIQANIPDKANRAVLPYRVKFWQNE